MKRFFNTLILIMFISIMFACSSHKNLSSILKPGDIIFHPSNSRQSTAIKLATNSEYSHCGIIYESKGKLYVFEAVQPVKLTPLQDWIDRGVNGHYVVKRLKDANKILTPTVLKTMFNYGKKQLGKNYDDKFSWDDDTMYCSEIIWKMYKQSANIEIGKLRKLNDFDLSHPFVKKIMNERYTKGVPYNETVISPQDIFECPKLIEVTRN